METANSYVKALRELSLEMKDDSLDQDVIDFQLVLEKNPEIMEFFLNHLYDFSEKVDFIDSLKQQDFSEYFLNFLKVIISEKDQKFLKEILKKYHLQKLKDQGIFLGVIYTTHPLSQDEISNLEIKFSKKINKMVQFTNKIDEKLISGIKVIIDGLVYDYSIDQKLKQLKQELLKQEKEINE